MSKPARVWSNRNTLRGILLLGLSAVATAPALALEPTPVNERITSRLSVQRRTDDNVQKDIAAAKAFREKQIAAETKPTISFSAPPMESDTKSTEAASSSAESSPAASKNKLESDQADLPKYGSSNIKTPKADDAATTPPALGATGKSPARNSAASSSGSTPKADAETKTADATDSISSIVTSEALIESIDSCGNIVLTPAICVDQVTIAAGPATVVRSAKPATTATTKDQLTEKGLRDKIAEISGGSFAISPVQPKHAEPQEVTSGYRYVAQADTQPTSTLRIIETPQPLRPIQSQSVTTMRPITYLTAYAQDAEAAATPTLNSGSAVVPAAFQGGIAMPENGAVLPSSPSPGAASGIGMPPSSFNANPPSPAYEAPAINSGAGGAGAFSSPAINSNPSATSQPYLGGGTTVTPLGSGPAPLSPTHQPYDSVPLRSAPVTTGEPFVGEPPCQFDAAYMVAPVNYTAVQNTAPAYCTPWATATAPVGAYPQATVPGYSPPGYYAPSSIAMSTAYGTQYSNTGVAVRPLFNFGQTKYPYQVGQGLIGQPVAYIPGQSFRNFFRYFFP